MKIVGWSLGGIVLFAVLMGILQTAASERVEVVELHTQDAAGHESVTRLWIVDHEGAQYLRVGVDGSGWFDRVMQNPAVKVTRRNETRLYRASIRPDLSETVNNLMQAKYTWGDTVIGLVFGREGAIPIELVPEEN